MGVGALATGLAMPGAAGAYATPQCQGTTANGIGASLQKDAQLGQDGLADSSGWAFDFSTLNNSVCSGGVFDAKPSYQALGSGAGLAAMCSNGVNLNTAFDFGASDDPPTPTQLNNMDNCSAAAGGVGSTLMHNIPVAQAAIGIAVHLPTGCTINSADFASTGDRFSILSANLEKAFLGDGSVTWSTLLPNSPSCSGPVQRVVRYDQSGSTYQFTAGYLAQIADASTWQATGNSAQQYQNWPNNTAANIVYGGTTQGGPTQCPLSGPNNTPPDPNNSGQTQPASRSLCNGAGNLAQAVKDTPGSIGYVDMATQISKGFQYSPGQSFFWIPVQHNGTGTKSATFAEPNLASNGYQAGHATGGANCASATYTPPSAPDPTTVSWQNVFGENPSTGSYPVCTITYELVWDDAANAYGNTPAIDARQRSVKDYVNYILSNSTVNDGQNVLRALNYDPLPANVLTVSRNGAASVHFP